MNLVAVTETWFKPELEIQLPGYVSLFHSRKDRRGGGVAIYIKNDPDIRYSSMEISSDTGYEFATLKLSLRSKDLTVCVVYRPPNLSSESSNLLYERIRSLPGRNLLLMGDRYYQLISRGISGCNR